MMFTSLHQAYAASHATVSPTEQKAPPVQFLLTKSAADFNAHRQLYPSRFRAVRVGHLFKTDGAMRYILCGQFLPTQNKAQNWVPFVTVDTHGGPHGYEQWLGGVASSLCQKATVTWDSKGDLSAALLRKLQEQQ
ncbi:hypothetical protein [Gallaecimonas sp. GXIMD1310]|uniref:hypothetical protein n=1 Tax=Gallaecimonas sp. GXIMD1310 TaxID=3131926 RepID=UPI00325565D2